VYRDFEITDTVADKFNPDPGSNPANRRPNGVSVFGSRIKIIDFSVHDTGDGIGFNEAAVDTEVYGTVIARSGWVSTDRAHGHGLYVQNQLGLKRITDTFVLDSYDAGVHLYGSAGHVIGVRLDGLVVANSGSPVATGPDRVANLLIGTDQNPPDDIQVSNSVFYQPVGTNGTSLRVGYGVTGVGVGVTNSYLVGGGQAIEVDNWQQTTVTGNTFYVTRNANANANTVIAQVANPGTVAWDGNSYYDSSGVENFACCGQGYFFYPTWRQVSGYDTTSSYSPTAPPDKAIIQPNAYEPGRYNITVLNWTRQPTVTVDLAPGIVWFAYDARNMGTPVASGIGPVVLPTPDEFGAYVIRSSPATTTTIVSSTPAPVTTQPGVTTTTAVATTVVPTSSVPPTTKPKGRCRKFLWWCF